VFAKVPENFDEFTCTVEEASDEGDTVVVTARFKGKNKNGVELDTQAEHVWEVRDGRSRGSRARSTRRPGPRAGAERTGAGRPTSGPRLALYLAEPPTHLVNG